MSTVESTLRAPDDPDACRRCGCSLGPIEADALGIRTHATSDDCIDSLHARVSELSGASAYWQRKYNDEVCRFLQADADRLKARRERAEATIAMAKARRVAMQNEGDAMVLRVLLDMNKELGGSGLLHKVYARARKAERELQRIDAACLKACPDNTEAMLEEDSRDDLVRYLVLSENGHELIHTDDPAEVVASLHRLWGEVSDRLENELHRADANERDASRYRQLRALYHGVDFEYGNGGGALGITALVFKLPANTRVSASLDDTLAAASGDTTTTEN